jgi:dipeptidyl aminopeptidase/acylaminoacyl peptidase
VRGSCYATRMKTFGSVMASAAVVAVLALPACRSKPASFQSTGAPAPREVTGATPLLHGGVAPQIDETLVPREVFFGNPQRTNVELSPNGERLAFLAPKDGVLNVFVAPLADPSAAKPVTDDDKRGIRRYTWAHDNRHILYSQDEGGDENWHVYAVDVDSGEQRDLTPFEGVNAYLAATSHRAPGAVVVAQNERNEQLHDLYRVDIATCKQTLLEQNDEGFIGYLLDDDFAVRLALAYTQAGGVELKVPKAGGWETLIGVGPEDALTTEPVVLDKTGRKLYLKDSRGRDKAALVEVDLATAAGAAKKGRVVFEPDRADVSAVLTHPRDHTIQAVAQTYERTEWKAIDPKVEASLAEIQKLAKGDVEVVSQSLDDRHWIVADIRDDGPVAYYHYDRAQKKERFLFFNRPELAELDLAKMQPRVIRSRDGLDLVSYLTLPEGSDPDGDGKPDRALPMVLLVHGGPWGRDEWGYDADHQWLASRGYAVLSVNFRGSTGFGKSFINAADGEWAGKMHDDLLDAVRWAVSQRVADPDRVAIFGGSYGGYSVLVGLTFTPREFACGVDIVGPSNLVTLLENIPPYWMPIRPILTQRVGDHQTEAGRAFLLERSPLTHVEKIERPLLIAQGKNDPRVKQQESDQIVRAMQDKKIPVVYVLYPDEGHGFARPENRLSFSAVTEIFLAQCLGGSYRPIGDDFEGSSITVVAGAEHVWGLPEALPKQP